MLMEDFQKGLPSSGSNSSGLSTDKWLVVEKRVEEILWTVQPNVTSEWRRREIIDYIQRVIKGCFGTEVRLPQFLFFFCCFFFGKGGG